MEFVISNIELITAFFGFALALLTIVKFIHHIFDTSRTVYF
jgi:hypothetical protein